MLTHTHEQTNHDESSSDADVSPIQLPRSSGLLLHISSLPSRYGIGDLGPSAYRFADPLAETGQRIWQVLPLVPVGLGNSPYSSPSTFAGNPLFISPEKLADSGLLKGDIHVPDFPEDKVDFPQVIETKYKLLERAFDQFSETASEKDRSAFQHFCEGNAYWLEDYALFMALKAAFGGLPWTEWPAELASRDAQALEEAGTEHSEAVGHQKFFQFLFFRQWNALKTYCTQRGISLFGDLPIYVAHDSADVWAHRDLFFLDESGHSTVVAGVPPDYFSETGQRWGNPIYRWDRMQENGYDWWTRRFESIFDLVDFARLDHFRAFAGYWEIPASEETAINGKWVEGPGAALFHSVENRLGPLPLVAEDLGMITPDVKELMEVFGFPGMAVLQFAFAESADHPFLPHSLKRNVVAYTGTHDNDTMAGWWHRIQTDSEQERSMRFVQNYLGTRGKDEIHWSAIRAMLASPADYVVIPVQDILGLGSNARMNTPGSGHGNWTWRLRPGAITPEHRDRLKTLTAVYGRSDVLDDVI